MSATPKANPLPRLYISFHVLDTLSFRNTDIYLQEVLGEYLAYPFELVYSNEEDREIIYAVGRPQKADGAEEEAYFNSLLTVLSITEPLHPHFTHHSEGNL